MDYCTVDDGGSKGLACINGRCFYSWEHLKRSDAGKATKSPRYRKLLSFTSSSSDTICLTSKGILGLRQLRIQMTVAPFFLMSSTLTWKGKSSGSSHPACGGCNISFPSSEASRSPMGKACTISTRFEKTVSNSDM